MKRSLSETEKQTVHQQQIAADGSLRCFISGDIIGPNDVVEYDHVQAFSKSGETSIANMRVVLKEHNRRKSDQSLYDVRDNIRLERLFAEKQNNIRLQDILELKDVKKRSTHAVFRTGAVRFEDGQRTVEFPLFADAILKVDYFYGRVPVEWLENDDQEGLQPRVIDYKRLIAIRDHLKAHPQLAPSIGRLIGNQIKLFDGQHKLAAQILNNQNEIDIKVYVSPEADHASKMLFDNLMITNLEAHSKLKQIPFYTSTLLDRLSVIYREHLDSFIACELPENHSEENFVRYLAARTTHNTSEAKEFLRSEIKTAALDGSELSTYVAKASKDASFPMTVDLLNKTIFRATLYLEPSKARFTSEGDYRTVEAKNFAALSKILVDETGISSWVQNIKGKSLTNSQLKARRIWHRGSVLTWSPYLRSILYFALQIQTNAEREQMLYRPPITEKQGEVTRACLHRLFSHTMWDDPEPEIDSLLVSARRQDDLFVQKGLTERYVLYGES